MILIQLSTFFVFILSRPTLSCDQKIPFCLKYHSFIIILQCCIHRTHTLYFLRAEIVSYADIFVTWIPFSFLLCGCMHFGSFHKHLCCNYRDQRNLRALCGFSPAHIPAFTLHLLMTNTSALLNNTVLSSRQGAEIQCAFI